MANTNRFNPGLFIVMIMTLGVAASTAFAAQKEAKVKILETPYVLEKPTGDTLIVESRYVAIVRGLAPALGDGYAPRSAPMRGPQSSTYARRGGPLANMVDSTPPDDLPSEDIRRFLSTQYGQAIRYRALNLQPKPPAGEHPTDEERRKAREECVHEYRILTSTPRRAEELARALILVYNTTQDKEKQAALEILEGLKKELPELKSARDKARASYDALRSRLNDLPEIRPETVSALETKKWLLAVDCAGAKTKQSAVQKLMLESGELSDAAREQLEEIRITVHIELAGIVARQEKVHEILKIAQDRAELLPKYEAAEIRLKNARTELEKHEQRTENYTQFLESSIFDHFKVENNTILIQPIQWQ